MKLLDSVAAGCRYGDCAVEAFGPDSEVIWEDSSRDYQSACILIRTPAGEYIHYEWTYGSCSGCDGWESAGLEGAQIVAEMKREAAVFDEAGILKYLLINNDTEFSDALETIRVLKDKPSIYDETKFAKMRATFTQWWNEEDR